jgi:restriction system protein
MDDSIRGAGRLDNPNDMTFEEHILHNLDEVLLPFLRSTDSDSEAAVAPFAERIKALATDSDMIFDPAWTAYRILSDFVSELGKYEGCLPGVWPATIISLKNTIRRIIDANKSDVIESCNKLYNLEEEDDTFDERYDEFLRYEENFGASYIEPNLSGDERIIYFAIRDYMESRDYKSPYFTKNLIKESIDAIQREFLDSEDDELNKACGTRDDQFKRVEEYLFPHLHQHKDALIRRHKQLVYAGNYGEAVYTDWKIEVDYFLKEIVGDGRHYIPLTKDLSDEDVDALCYKLITEKVERQATATRQQQTDVGNHNMPKINIGIEYEKVCANILLDAGWNVRLTQASGDQGADIIAEKTGRRLVVQCKYYNQTVGNKAVQEVFAAKEFQSANIAAVVTNNSFSTSARQLAAVTGVLLLHHDQLANL